MKCNNYRLLSLLVKYDKFQSFIKEVRSFLKIPDDGFANNKDIEKWTRLCDKEATEYFNSPVFKSHYNNIFKKVKLGEIDSEMGNKQLNLLGSKTSRNYLISSLKYVVGKFKLPSHFILPLKYYVLCNKLIFIPLENFSHVNDFKDEGVVKIEVYSKLTKKEGKDLLRMIKELTEDFPKISKISNTTMNQLSFEDWHKNRDTYTEKITAKDLALEAFESENDRQKVYDAKRELDRKRKRLFG